MGLVWLNVLKVSKRNWPVKRSVNFMFLNRERSVRQKPGPRMAQGRSFVSVVCVAGGAANADALNPTRVGIWRVGVGVVDLIGTAAQRRGTEQAV